MYLQGDDMSRKSAVLMSVLFILFVSVIPCLPSMGQTSYDNYIVYGKVKDSDGYPVPSAKVYLTFTGTDNKQHKYMDVTDNYGNYAFRLENMPVKNGTVLHLYVQVSNKVASDDITVTDGYPLMEVNLELGYSDTATFGDTSMIFFSSMFSNWIIVFTVIAWLIIILLVIGVVKIESKRRGLIPKM